MKLLLASTLIIIVVSAVASDVSAPGWLSRTRNVESKPWKHHGAVSVYGHAYGAVVPIKDFESVEYWLIIQFWNNHSGGTERDEAERPVNPGDVKLISEQEPVIVTNDGKWEITFKP